MPSPKKLIKEDVIISEEIEKPRTECNNRLNSA